MFRAAWLITGLILATALGACGEAGTKPAVDSLDPVTGRWYSDAQVQLGRQVFLQHCADCHAESAQGLVMDWRTKQADGAFPPPPLNGTAHAWHHPLSVLRQTIDEGGVALGGKMPAFGTVLAEADKYAAIAYFQHFWTDETYQSWLTMGGIN